MKHIMKSILFLSAAFFNSIMILNAQERDITLKIKQVPFAFEGIIENIEIYPGDKNGNRISENSITRENGVDYFFQADGSKAIGYSLATIKLCKVYNGKTIENEDKIYILTSSPEILIYKQDGEIRHMNFSNSHSTDFVLMPSSKGMKYLFFCNKNSKNQYTISDKNLLVSFNLNFEKETTGVTKSNTSVIYAEGLNKVFYSKEELKSFLATISGLNTNAKDKCIAAEKKSDVETENEGSIKINYQQNLENYNKWLEFAIQRQKNSQNKSSRAVTDLDIQIANARMVGADAAPWLEFDILVSSNNNVYYDGCLMRIQYNTSAFGSNIVANSGIQITRATPYNTTTYTNPQTDVIDQTSNTIGLPFGSNFSAPSWSRPQLTSTPTVMLTIRFKVQTCNQFANVDFTDITFTPMFSFYTTTPNDNITNGIAFDNTNYSGNIFDRTCVPIINSFTNNIPAGAQQIVTITGKYFGVGKSSGTVIFKDANLGDKFPPVGGTNNGGIQHYDVVSWTHDEIKIKLPGTIDSSTSLAPIPGSGFFKLKNRYGQTVVSPSKITIPYAVFQYADIFPIYRKVSSSLSGQNNNGYIVHLNPSVTSTFPNAKPVIRKAMKDWSCVSGINWKLGNDTALVHSNDGVCVISLGNFSTLQRTYPEHSVCPSASGNTYYLKSFDIEIKNPFSNPTYSWQVDTTGDLQANKYDFYHAIAHELGHAHLLEHANDTLGDIMFWAAWNGYYPLSQRKTVSNSSGAPTGAQYVASNLVGGLTCSGNHLIVIPTNCTGIIGINESFKNPLNLSVYPNPSNSNQNITIAFKLESESLAYINMYDITGKLVKTTQPEKVKDTDYTISMEGINQGLYLLQITVGNKRQSVKIIKQ